MSEFNWNDLLTKGEEATEEDLQAAAQAARPSDTGSAGICAGGRLRRRHDGEDRITCLR